MRSGLQRLSAAFLISFSLAACNTRTPAVPTTAQQNDVQSTVATPTLSSGVGLIPSPTDTPMPSSKTTPLQATIPQSTTVMPSQPLILNFMAEPVEADPGGDVILTWSSQGGTKATIQQKLPADLLGESLSVPPDGSITVALKEQERYWHVFELVVLNDSGQSDQLSVTIQIRCPYPFFFSPPPTGDPWGSVGCPYKPASSSPAAEQVFEHGRMIWLQEVPAESTSSGIAQGPSIYVLYEDSPAFSGQIWRRFDDTWTPNEPENDPSIAPPEGLYQPVRGFGKVWRDNSEVRERLGWALTPERSFSGAYQIDWRPYYLVGNTYLRDADGRLISLGVMGSWR